MNRSLKQYLFYFNIHKYRRVYNILLTYFCLQLKVEFLTTKSKCQSSLFSAPIKVEYHKRFLEVLKKLDENLKDYDTKEVVWSDNSYVELEFLLYGGLMSH